MCNINELKQSIVRKLPILWALIILSLIGLLPPSSMAKPLAVTSVSGVISTNTTWTLANSPYLITSNITVSANITLTVEAGVIVKTRDNTRLELQGGHLQAIGTAAAPITFTSELDYDGNQWAGLYFNGGTGHLNHTIVRYGGDWSNANIRINAIRTGGEVLIENSQINFSGMDSNNAYPISINIAELHQVRMINNSFSGNFPNQIWISGGTLLGNTTLSPQTGLDSYYLAGNVIVGGNSTLTIEPGTIIKNALSYLEIQGDLQAIGTATKPIIFTSNADTDGNQWDGLYFNGGSGHLNHTVVRYGGYSFPYWSLKANIFVRDIAVNKQLLIENSQILNAGTAAWGANAIIIEASEIHQVKLVNNRFNGNNPNEIEIRGSAISSNVTLSPQTGLVGYTFYSNLTVNSGTTLTLEPGVVIKGANKTMLDIQGNLQAIGSSAKPIVFTSSADTDVTQWSGLYFNGGSGHLNHTVVRYGGYGFSYWSLSANILVKGGTVTTNKQVLIENSRVINSGGTGFIITKGQATINCSTFTANNGAGISLPSNTVTANPTLAINSSNFYSNTLQGIKNDSTTQVDARNNWWGDAGGPNVGAGDGVFGNVLTMPVKSSFQICDGFGAFPTTIGFNADEGGTNPTPQAITVTRAGSGSLNWTATSDVSWLSLSATSGIGTGVITASVNIAGLAAGTHTGNVTVSSPGVTNTQTIPVALTLAAKVTGADAFEVDDACTQAQPLTVDGSSQAHTLHDSGDQDWASFTVISGTTYIIEALTPNSSKADLKLEIYDACGSGAKDNQSDTFTSDVRFTFLAPSSGTYYTHVSNEDSNIFGADVKYNLSINSVPNTANPGAVIIVAGRLRTGDPLQSNIHKMTNKAYDTFISQGYNANLIQYLATDSTLPGYDAPATRANLQAAITTWVAGKVDANRSLTIYMMDHGDKEKLYLDNMIGETLTPSDLDGWLTSLEASTGVKVNIILEACYTGSFIGVAPKLSKFGRVVITSASDTGVAYASPTGGAIFSETFFDALKRGFNIYGAFEESRKVSVQAHADHQPWLDDNGDGVANTAADGQVASVRTFASAGTFSSGQIWPPYIAKVTGDSNITLTGGKGQGLIQAEVLDDVDTTAQRVWAVIYPPSYEPPAGQSELVNENLLSTIDLTFTSNNSYQATYTDFSENGNYRVVIYAQDSAGLTATPIGMIVAVGNVSSGNVYLPVIIK